MGLLLERHIVEPSRLPIVHALPHQASVAEQRRRTIVGSSLPSCSSSSKEKRSVAEERFRLSSDENKFKQIWLELVGVAELGEEDEHVAAEAGSWRRLWLWWWDPRRM